MIALEPAICARLRTALDQPATAGWTVMGASEPGRRDPWPLASVSVWDGTVPKANTNAIRVEIGWRVQLIARRSPDAAAQLDTAFTATVAALHGWWPPSDPAHPAHKWDRLAVANVRTPEQSDDGLIGLEIALTTAATYHGTPDSQ